MERRPGGRDRRHSEAGAMITTEGEYRLSAHDPLECDVTAVHEWE